MKTFGELKTGDYIYIIYKGWFENKYKIGKHTVRLRHYKFNTRIYDWSATVPNNASIFKLTPTYFYCADINAVFNCINDYELE